MLMIITKLVQMLANVQCRKCTYNYSHPTCNLILYALMYMLFYGSVAALLVYAPNHNT